MSGDKRWFITGVSGGFGRLLAETRPLRLVPEADALSAFRNKLKSVDANLAEWERVSLSTGLADS